MRKKSYQKDNSILNPLIANSGSSFICKQLGCWWEASHPDASY